LHRRTLQAKQDKDVENQLIEDRKRWVREAHKEWEEKEKAEKNSQFHKQFSNSWVLKK